MRCEPGVVQHDRRRRHKVAGSAAWQQGSSAVAGALNFARLTILPFVPAENQALNSRSE